MSLRVRVGTALSQFAHAFIGHPDMTISTHAHLVKVGALPTEYPETWRRIHSIAEALFGAGHCQSAWEDDVRFADDIKQIEASLSA